MTWGIHEPVPAGGITVPRYGVVTFRELVEDLPHGSGIDADWYVSANRRGTCATFANSFHCMDENGFYDGWIDFRVILKRVDRDVLHPLIGPCAGQFQVLYRKGDWKFDVIGRFSSRSGKYSDLGDAIHEWVDIAWVKYKFGIRSGEKA